MLVCYSRQLMKLLFELKSTDSTFSRFKCVFMMHLRVAKFNCTFFQIFFFIVKIVNFIFISTDVALFSIWLLFVPYFFSGKQMKSEKHVPITTTKCTTFFNTIIIRLESLVFKYKRRRHSASQPNFFKGFSMFFSISTKC